MFYQCKYRINITWQVINGIPGTEDTLVKWTVFKLSDLTPSSTKNIIKPY